MARHPSIFAKCVEDVRRFNRFYTSKIGVLEKDYLGTRHSVTEARVIYELSLRGACTASDVARFLEVDAGYLSRLLKSLERSAVISRSQSSADRRESIIRLTGKGQCEAALVDQRSQEIIGRVITGLTPAERLRLVHALNVVERLLGATPARGIPQRSRPSVSGPNSPPCAYRGIIGLTKILPGEKTGEPLATPGRVTSRTPISGTVKKDWPGERVESRPGNDETAGARDSRRSSGARARMSQHKRGE